MKRLLWIVLVMLVAGNAFGAFPGVPSGVTSTRISGSGNDLTDLYVWAEGGHTYVRLVPIDGDPFWCSLQALQSFKTANSIQI